MAAPGPFGGASSSSSSSAPVPAPAPVLGLSPHHGHGHGSNAVAHYRPTLGMNIGLDAYQTLNDPYRQTQQQQHQQLPPFEQLHQSQQQQQHHHNHGRQQQGQFGILAPMTVPDLSPSVPQAVYSSHTQQAQAQTQQHQEASVQPSHGQLSSKFVIDPPDLQAWREKLFNVDDMIVLSHEQFETYFPHIDNVYSHRSTQRYKRKPFVSHYWDCRMKGRPPGTPKSDDPNKKKRKRSARERDLCDVKIKITEYFAGAQLLVTEVDPEAEADASAIEARGRGMFAAAQPQGPLFDGTVTVAGQRFWTIQRVNGTGGNGKGDGFSGPHKHSLAKSDEIKKNSVQRHLAKQEKEAKKLQKPAMRKPTGPALATTRRHAKDNDLKLFAACFCPFSQRVWIALEAKCLPYQYCEIDPYEKPTPTQLLEANPRGLVPAIRQGEWACAESGVILEYLEDMGRGVPLFPTDPMLKANCRLWVDHASSNPPPPLSPFARVNIIMVPAFYALLDNQDPDAQSGLVDRLQTSIDSLVLAADENGPFFLGVTLCLVDIHLAPFALRLSRVLTPSRGWPEPVPGTRWHRWLTALEGNIHVKATTSGLAFYTETTDLLTRHSAGK